MRDNHDGGGCLARVTIENAVQQRIQVGLYEGDGSRAHLVVRFSIGMRRAKTLPLGGSEIAFAQLNNLDQLELGTVEIFLLRCLGYLGVDNGLGGIDRTLQIGREDVRDRTD